MGKTKSILSTIHYLLSTERKRAAFTLIELVIFTAIFTVTIIAFISVLISITRTQVRQGSVAEVNQQSQFVLQAVQYYVERSSLIDMPLNTATTSAKLRMRISNPSIPSTNEDPVLIFASGTSVYAKIGPNPVMALTSSKVTVSNFSLAKKSNAPGKDSLSVSFNISYNSSNPQQMFAQGIQSAVSRVSAASFDSGIYPSSPGDSGNKLGATSMTWNSINDVLYFGSSNNVGVGGNPGTALFQVHNGDVYIDNSSNGVVFNNGSGCYRVQVSASGTVVSAGVSCP